MRLSFLVILFSLIFTTVCGQSDTADAYLAAESPIAKANLLANIGPSGSKSQGAKAGIVIASPSTTNPNYLFTWIRDASLVFQTLIDQCVCDRPSKLCTST
jgi:glucoamylase